MEVYLATPLLATHLLKTPSEADCKSLSCQLKKKILLDLENTPGNPQGLGPGHLYTKFEYLPKHPRESARSCSGPSVYQI